MKLKELTASYFGESVSYLPLLVNPDNNMKYIFSIPGVSNSNRDNLYEHFYGKNIIYFNRKHGTHLPYYPDDFCGN